jgi:predicted membrane-bound dolichyl-phosphate-mannose-protein mannosyltransferase
LGPNFGRTERDYVCGGQMAAVAALFASLKAMTMLDFAMIAIGVAFFVASVLYVLACERM